MYSLDKVIKEFKTIIKIYDEDSIERNYYEIIVRNLLLENKYKKLVEDSNKPLYHYFKYSLPVSDREYFLWLYNPYNPVRFSVETFDSIEEIKQELKND